MKSISQLSSLSLLQRASIVVCSPLALCCAAFAACLVAYDGNRLTAAILTSGVLIVPSFLGIMLMTSARRISPGPRFDAFMAMSVSAMYVGLSAFALGTGWALIEFLRSHGGHYGLGGTLPIAFAVGIIALLCAMSRRQFGLQPEVMAFLSTAAACGIACLGCKGSLPVLLTVASSSAAVLLVVFFTIRCPEPS